MIENGGPNFHYCIKMLFHGTFEILQVNLGMPKKFAVGLDSKLKRRCFAVIQSSQESFCVKLARAGVQSECKHILHHIHNPRMHICTMRQHNQPIKSLKILVTISIIN